MKNQLAFLLGLLVCVFAGRSVNAQMYEVRDNSVNYEKKERAAAKVLVDGTPEWTRSFWQSWLKDTYNIKPKGNGTFGVGKRDVLAAKQVSASSVSGKLIDLYAMVAAPSDSVTELAVFGSYDDKTYFSPESTPSEFAAMRTMAQNFATAARLKAYREQIEASEKELRDTEKEKERLEKERVNLAKNTENNLEKIESLKKQNIDNKLKASQDSTQLVVNAQQLELRKAKLQRRKDRLTTLGRK